LAFANYVAYRYHPADYYPYPHTYYYAPATTYYNVNPYPVKSYYVVTARITPLEPIDLTWCTGATKPLHLLF